ncbi:MAG: hypothetical protein NTY01_09885 [Verrucomicrobia bacterium]|nr:hypothetical protein [Verrucomicrobiota bacterium]
MNSKSIITLASLISLATAAFAETAAKQPLAVDLGKGLKLEMVWASGWGGMK